MRSILINGEVTYNATSQILNSNTFKKILSELIKDSEEKKNSLLPLFEPFLKNTDTVDTAQKYDIEGIIELLLALTIDPIEKIDGSPYYSFPKMSNKKDLLVRFVESLFSLWRNKHRFIIKRDEYTNRFERIFKQMLLVRTNTDLKGLCTQYVPPDTHKRLGYQAKDPQTGTGRCTRWVSSLTSPPWTQDEAKNADWLYGGVCLSIVFEPPVIFTPSRTSAGCLQGQ